MLKEEKSLYTIEHIKEYGKRRKGIKIVKTK